MGSQPSLPKPHELMVGNLWKKSCCQFGSAALKCIPAGGKPCLFGLIISLCFGIFSACTLPHEINKREFKSEV